jgi:hypothetical protein
VGRREMKKFLKVAMVAILVGFIVSCAPSAGYYYIDKDKIPLPSALDFPITDLVERIVAAKGPYPGFNYALGKIHSKKVSQFVYNIPEIGEFIEIEFYTTPNSNYDWSVGIYYPKIKPNQLFKTDQISPITDSPYKWNVFKVISGPLEGACVKDFSLTADGSFLETGDHAIVIFSIPNDLSTFLDDRCY